MFGSRVLLGVVVFTALACSGKSELVRGGSAQGEGGEGPMVIDGGEDDAAPDENAVPLDVSTCAMRAEGDCTGIQESYESGSGLDDVPALAACERFQSFDGCGVLEFFFDEYGCAFAVGPGPGGWDASEHLADLRECLTGTFASARFPCLASRKLAYHESCFIR